MRLSSASSLIHRASCAAAPFSRNWRLPVLTLLLSLWPVAVRAQIEFEDEPINYDTATTTSPVSKLQNALDSGDASLDYDSQRGYLPALLELLEIDPSSQVLVHSKTSLHQHRI